jgi:hypothetical protein
MKNTIKLLIIFLSLLTISCTDDIENKVSAEKAEGISLLTPTSTFNLVLDGAKLNDLATTFVWNDTAKSTIATGISYTVEAAKAGTNFAAVVVIGAPTMKQFLDVKVSTLDAATKALGMPAMVEGAIDVRVKSSAGTSNVFTLKVTPYQPSWGVIGSATPLGWDASTEMTFNQATGTYSVTLPLTTGEFKFRLDNKWDTNFGDTGNNLSLEPAGDNIAVTAGFYTIIANFTTKMYTITRVTNAWGVIGDATPKGWDADTFMDFDPTTGKYSIIVKMKSGAFKFRLNRDWGNNFGDNGNDLSLEAGGDNIPVTTLGTYLIIADFTARTYTIRKI